MSIKVFRADIDVPESAPWAIIPDEWEDGDDNQLGYGPVKGDIDAAHAVAARKIPGQQYTLVRLIKP